MKKIEIKEVLHHSTSSCLLIARLKIALLRLGEPLLLKCILTSQAQYIGPRLLQSKQDLRLSQVSYFLEQCAQKCIIELMGQAALFVQPRLIFLYLKSHLLYFCSLIKLLKLLFIYNPHRYKSILAKLVFSNVCNVDQLEWN